MRITITVPTPATILRHWKWLVLALLALALVAIRPAPSSATGNSIVTADDGSFGDVGQFLSMKLDSRGNPVIAYWDGPHRIVKVLHCGSPTCSGGNSITSPNTAVNPQGGPNGYTSLALDSSG